MRGERRNHLEDLIYAPWWANIIILIAVNIFIRKIIPIWFTNQSSQGHTGKILSGAVTQAAPMIANMFSIAIGFTLILSIGRTLIINIKNKKNKSYNNIEIKMPNILTHKTLQEMEWFSFERLCEEYIKAEGNIALRTQSGKDGGVDIYIYDRSLKNKLAIVQCKAWNKYVGVSVARELHGVMVSEKVDVGIIMITGKFSDDAIEYAIKNGIGLINGEKLIEEINNLPNEQRELIIAEVLNDDYKTPTCPSCNIKMKFRENNNFWGCPNYFKTPKCTNRIYAKKPLQA